MFALPLLVLSMAQPARPAESNPLAVYDGTWHVTIAGKTDELVNHCSGTADDYSCDQVLNGKPIATVAFHRTAQNHYATRVTLPDGKVAGEGALDTGANPWLWTDGPGSGPAPRYSKTENLFRDHDHIHFAIYSSPDGNTWTKQSEGDEERTGAARP